MSHGEIVDYHLAQEVLLDGKQDSAYPGAYPHLVIDMLQVVPHGVLAQREVLRELALIQSFAQQA